MANSYVDEMGWTCQDDSPLDLVTSPPSAQISASCPCGWGPNGTPLADVRGVWTATLPAWWNFGQYVTNTHPSCLTWFEYTFPYTECPMNPCWQEYLQMPFCTALTNGTNSSHYATDPNQLGYAKCRLASDIRAMTAQQRKDIYDNTYSGPNQIMGQHMGGKASVPVFVMTNTNPSGGGAPWRMHGPNPLPPHQNGGWAKIALRLFHINSNGSLATFSCGRGHLACPNVCIGCTTYTSTTCNFPVDTDCSGFDPAASFFWGQPTGMIQNPITLALSSDPMIFGAPPINSIAPICCVEGCTNPLSSNYDPSANCDDGSCVFSGCTNSTAINYDPLATIDDGSCIYPAGCLDSQAYNFDPNSYGCYNGSGVQTLTNTSCCLYPTWHCQIPTGGCVPQNNQSGELTSTICLQGCIIGCTDTTALNYDSHASIPCGPFNGYPSYLSCCDYPIIYGCTDPLALAYNQYATVDDGSCTYQTGRFAWNCIWGSIYDPNIPGFNSQCNYVIQNGAFYPSVNHITNTNGCWAWDGNQSIWSVVFLQPGGGQLPFGTMLLFDSTNPHPVYGDLTDPNNSLLTNPLQPLFVWNSNITTYNGITNFGYWMPIMAIPQPPNWNYGSPNTGYIPNYFVRVWGSWSITPLWSSTHPPAQCCIVEPGVHPCPPIIIPPNGGEPIELDIPGIESPTNSGNGFVEMGYTPMTYNQLGLKLKDASLNITITEIQVHKAFKGKEVTPVVVPPLMETWEWWRCNPFSSPCFCEPAPYVNGQQVLDMINYGGHYMAQNDSACLQGNNCCDPLPTTSWDCEKRPLDPIEPGQPSPSGWRYACIEKNHTNGEFATQQQCIGNKCEGDPNKSYSTPCVGGHCTEHNNNDCGGSYTSPCYAYRQDCDASHNC